MLRVGTEDRASWSVRLREVPVGVLVIAAVLVFLGVGTLLAGLYLIIAEAPLGLSGWAMILVASPISLYMALHLVRGSHWAWRTMMIVLVLLLLSSILRAVFSPGVPGAAFLEMAVELICLAYLSRAQVRAAFAAP